MNQFIFTGRTTADIELHRSESGVAYASFSLAINRPKKEDGTDAADYPRITCFGKTAENASEYVRKGSLILVDGRVETEKYEDKGETKFVTKFIARRIEFLNLKSLDLGEPTIDDFDLD